jgi:hypothetical protein
MFVASHRAAACDSEISLESRNAESGHFAATPPVCCTASPSPRVAQPDLGIDGRHP